MTLVEFHARLANTALFYTIIMAGWGLWRFYRRQGIASSYWGSLVIAEALYLVQAGIGAYLFISGSGELTRGYMHILYGVISVLVIPAAFFFTHGNE